VRVKLVEPGMIKTDFGGRSFDFNNDPQLIEYQPLVQALTRAFRPMMEKGSTPESIAEVVYAAVTDDTDRLRYEAGPDAGPILANRRTADDATFTHAVKKQFALA